jgi:hypothetical protein
MQAKMAELELSDEQVTRIATKLSDQLMKGFRDAGAFDPPMEPVAPPAQPTVPSATPEAPAAPAGDPAPPERKTFAQRFMGV